MILSKAAALRAWKDHPICLRDSTEHPAVPQPRPASRLISQPGHPVPGKAEPPVHPRSQGKTSTESSPRAGIPGQCPAAGQRDVCQSCGAKNKYSRAEKSQKRKKSQKKKKANTYLSPKETHSAQEAGFGGTEWKCGEFAIYTNYRSVF